MQMRNSASRHEFLLYFTAHPIPTLLSEIVNLMGASAYVPGQGYFINDPILAKEILQDERFTKAGKGSTGAIITQIMGEYSLLNMDGISHRELRSKLADLFSAKYVSTFIHDVLDELTLKLQDDLRAGEEVDLVRFMHHVTGKMICHMIGMEITKEKETETYDTIFNLVEKIIASVQLTNIDIPESKLSTYQEYFEQLIGFAQIAFEKNDIRTHSVVQRLKDLGLSFDEAKGVLGVLFVAGTETVSSSMPRLIALLLDSCQFEEVKKNRELIAGAIDEGLRFCTPVPVMTRSVSENIRIGNYTFKKKRRLVIFLYNILKSKRYFIDPRRYDIHRKHDPKIKHMWFGGGPHFCLGFALAHKEMSTILEVLLDLPGRITITDRQYGKHVLLPQYAQLKIKLNTK